MSNRFELPLLIRVRPSLWLLAGIYIGHLGAVPVLIIAGIPIAVKFLLITALLASLVHSHYLFIAQKNSDSPVEVLLNNAGEWWLSVASGDTLQVTLKPMAFVHPYLVVLLFRGDKRTYRVILTPDTVNPDTFRRLRVRLRFRHNQM